MVVSRRDSPSNAIQTTAKPSRKRIRLGRRTTLNDEGRSRGPRFRNRMFPFSAGHVGHLVQTDLAEQRPMVRRLFR